MLHFISGSWTFLFFRMRRPILRIRKQFLRIASSEGLLSLRFKAAWQFFVFARFLPSINLRALSYLFWILEIAFFAHIFSYIFCAKKSGRYCTRFDKNMVIFENIPLNLPGEYRLAFRHSGGGCGIRTDVWQSPLRLCLCRDREGRV